MLRTQLLTITQLMVLLGNCFLGNWHCSSCLKSFYTQRQIFWQRVGGKKDKRNDGKREQSQMIISRPYNIALAGDS